MKLLRLLFLVVMMLRAIWQVIIRTWMLADYGVFSPIIAGGFMWATPINVNGTCMCKSSLHQWENWPLKQNICVLDLLIQKHPGTASSCVEMCWSMSCFTGMLWRGFGEFSRFLHCILYFPLTDSCQSSPNDSLYVAGKCSFPFHTQEVAQLLGLDLVLF